MDKTGKLNGEQLLQALQWRYATKRFDASKKFDAATVSALEKAVLLSPSSYGLQPYRALFISDPAVRARLLPHSWNQTQVTDCSHYVVFAARRHITAAEVERWVARLAQERGLQVAQLESYKKMMMGDLVEGARKDMIGEWTARQAYIALGNLLTAAAVLGVDACPMEGFVPSAYDRELGLESTDYRSVVACALGYRAANDAYATLKKVRWPENEVIQRI